MPVLAAQDPANRLDEAPSQLNEAQRAAVLHGVESDSTGEAGPLLIVAGAGSGKTSTLAHRVACLIAKGADPQRLLLLTFSRRAAQEMSQRAGHVLAKVLGLGSQTPPSLPWAGTFHGMGARLLRDYAVQVGLAENFTIHDRGDAEDLMGLVRHELGLTGTEKRFPLKSTCLSIYSRVVNTQGSLQQVLREAFPWCAEWEAQLKQLFGAYVEAKQEQNVLDYDDLLLGWHEMMGEPSLAAQLSGRFDHVLVDEYQDTNRLQASILQRLKPDGCGLTAVGDDAQSIYSFRGATVRNILDFPSQFSRSARIVTLERNYRSTQPILDVSNTLIAAAGERHAKRLWTDKSSAGRPQLVLVPDEAQQARWVADKVMAHREGGLRLKSQAVLFRTSSHSAALELELARRNIPFVKFGGLKFLEASHVKDLLALLRFAQNPKGRQAGFRVVQLMAGVGPATATRLLDAMDEASDPGAALQSFEPPAAAREQWSEFAAAYASLRSGQAAWPADAELALRWYLPHLERLHEDAAVRQADVEQLVRLAAGYGSRESFLTELTLDPPEATSDRAGPPLLDDDYLILSTIHSAKGQEWTSVHVLNVVDGCIPADLSTGSNEEIEEERRLLYVAMTRAKDHLHLLVPQRFYVTQQAAHGDRHLYAGRTRFIAAQDVKAFEEVVWPAPPERPPAVPAPQAAIDLRNRLRAAWR
ncbi:MAG: ATP-dependent helicase [Proteobacteria bacterium]|nr:ATP-dependent helicase [Pseudomonadota bacterium]